MPDVRPGVKSTEFWVALIAGLATVVQQQLFPNSPFPQAELTTVGLWVAARLGEKAFTDGNPEKRAWNTSEFWVAIGFAVLQQFTEIPAWLKDAANYWIVGRPAVKVAKDFSLTKLLGTKVETTEGQ